MSADKGSQFKLLGERRFAPFFWTQFFGAFNDNVLKNAMVILITYQAAKYLAAGSVFSGMQPGVIVNLAAALFILPYFFFSATAGQIADRMEKGAMIRIIKGVEIGIMVIGGWGFLAASLPALLGALFLMGVHSTFFGPVKYAYLPQQLAETELVGGNALVEAGTFIAVLAGTLTGGYLASLPDVGPHAAAAGGIVVAMAGFTAACLIPRSPAADPRLVINWNPVSETLRNYRFIRGNPVVFRSILGISWFWLYGALFLSQFPQYTKDVLHGDEATVTALLAIFSVGIGLGSLLCEQLSDHKIEIGLVPFGSIGLTVFGVDLYFASVALPHTPMASAWGLFGDAAHLRVVADLVFTGIFGGFFIVPMYALMQTRTEKSHVSRVVAGNNIFNALFMVAGAVAAIGLLSAGASVEQILLIAAVANALVALYIYKLVPEFLMRFMAWILVHSIYRLKKAGLERVPAKGAAVIVCNHVSFVDALVITAACHRPIRWVMDHHIFRVPVLSFFFRTVRAIPIASAKEDPAALERAFDEIARALERGELVGIFPEGRLTRDGEMNEFRGGIRRIIERTPVPVIPMALSGLWDSLFARNPDKAARGLRLFPCISLSVGDVVQPEAVTPEGLHARVLGLRGAGR